MALPSERMKAMRERRRARGLRELRGRKARTKPLPVVAARWRRIASVSGGFEELFHRVHGVLDVGIGVAGRNESGFELRGG